LVYVSGGAAGEEAECVLDVCEGEVGDEEGERTMMVLRLFVSSERGPCKFLKEANNVG
jgi:hypothetical protein